MRIPNGWMNPNVYSNESKAHAYVMTSRDPEICMEGPARTSKTNRGLRKIIGLHMKHEGFRSCILRANTVDLDESVRADLKDLIRFDLDDPRSPIRQYGGVKFSKLFINGGECALGGMNRPGKILGAEYDAIFISQLEQFTEEQYNILMTRCSGTSNKWKDSDGNPRSQMICDSNPDEPDHWMYQREEKGMLKFIKFGFKDNPFFYRKGRWSRVGKEAVNKLDRSVDGIYHDRYFKGLRVGPQGAVFNVKPCHLITELPWDKDKSKINDYIIYQGMDFGMSSPSTCIWMAQHKRTGDFIVFKEWRALHTDTLEMAEEIHNYTEDYELTNLKERVIDNDENLQSILMKCGLKTVCAKKGPDSIMIGLNIIKDCMNKTERGEPGGITFYTGMRCNRDSELIRQKLPEDTIKELKNLVFSDKKDDVEGSDHGIDPIRYMLTRIITKIEVKLPTVLGTIDLSKAPGYV